MLVLALSKLILIVPAHANMYTYLANLFIFHFKIKQTLHYLYYFIKAKTFKFGRSVGI